MNRTPWTIHHNTAKLSLDKLNAEIDLARPDLGLAGIQWAGKSLANWSLWQIEWDTKGPPSDAYVRENDLVATYERTSEQPLRLQIYWRALSNEQAPPNTAQPHASTARPHATGVEMIVSVQTELLDLDPRMRLTSRVANAECHATPNCVLCRPREGKTTFAHLVHPGDLSQVRLSSDAKENVTLIQTTLFARQLEKGVILRSRLRAYFMERANDEAVVRQLAELFAATEPPLTT